MAGIDDNIALVGDWSSSNPSPRTFFSKFLGDDFLSENADSVPLLESDKQKTSVDIVDRDGDVAFDPSDYTFADFKPNNVFGIPKPQSRGGLADRMAARAGFSALKINTARIRSENMGSSSPDARSPCVTIPPGLSPTTLLDSPVFLFNNLIQPSPTTGKFLLGQCTTTASTLISESSDKSKDPSISDVDTEPFAFKPHLESSPTNFAFGANQVDANVHKQQPVPIIEDSVQPQYLNRTVSLDAMVGHPQNPEEVHIQTMFRESSERKDVCNDAVCNQKSSSPALENEDSPPPTDQPEGDELKVDLASSVLGQPSEDGYNWRKYGQKQVKGSEYPRSYYKCTHPNCQVKKKVEQSPEGQVTEIIYKGTHVHPKPPPNRRAAIPSSHPYGEAQIDSSENPDLPPSAEVRPLWSTVPNGSASSDWRNDTLDTQSSISVAAEFCDPSNSEHTQDGPHFESAGAVDVSSQLSNDDEGEQATHGSVSRGGDGEEDESEFKRRKLDNSVLDMSAASRAVREPRVVVQTTSEVDILDDGYRWRKYGQKVVKGNPNPRSYYKCTSAGCTVRKHVERASHDLQSVITTYEGKHNHEVPAARNSSHASSVPSGAAASASQSHGIPRRPEASQMQESYSNFNTQSALGALGMHGREHLVPRAGFSFGLGQPGLTNLAMAGLGPSLPGKMHPPMHHPYLGQPPMSEAGSGFVIPKGELEDETMTDSGLPMPNSSAVYQQMMGRLPLGHQM